MVFGILLFSLILITTSLLVYWVLNGLRYWKKRGILHDPPHILNGNCEGLKTKYHLQDIIKSYYQKYKGRAPFVGFYFFQQPLAFILDLDLIKNILIKDFSNFSNRGRYYNEKDDPLSAHLFALENPKWRQLRQKITPTFTSGKMKFMYPTVLKVAEEIINVLQDMNDLSCVDVKELFARYTTDVIGTCAFGIECNSLKDPEAQFRLMGKRAVNEMNISNIKMALATIYPNIARKLGITINTKEVSSFFINVVKETVDLREKKNIRRNDFMDLLIELKNKEVDNITIEEVAAQAFVFFLAGFETSSSAGSFALYELALNQHIQDKARLEIDTILSKHNNVLSYECLKEMQYLDQILSGKFKSNGSIIYINI